jgi:Fe-S cluster biogenesis protein NfuA
MMIFNKQDRECVVTLSAAKGLARQAQRCFAALSMTIPVLVVKVHSRPAYLQRFHTPRWARHINVYEATGAVVLLGTVCGKEEVTVMQQHVQEHQRRAERIETLIQEIAELPDPQARATTEELIQALLEMYGEGLARILEVTAQTEASGQALIEALASDHLVGSLFLLHGLHPIDIEKRIAQALVEVRPYLKSHGGDVELIRVEDGVAYLRLEGSCHGCPSSTITLKLAIEEAIFNAAPDLDRLEVEGVTEPPPRPGVPVAFIPRRRSKVR